MLGDHGRTRHTNPPRKGRHKTGRDPEKKPREPRQKIACCRCRKRRKKCKPLQNRRGRCAACETRRELCQFMSVKDDPSMKNAKASSSEGSSIPPDISSSQETSLVSPLPPPNNNLNNLGTQFLTWQLAPDIQPHQPASSSSIFTPLSIYNPSPIASSTGHATSWQLEDDRRRHYSTSQSQPRVDSHSTYNSPGGQHMGYIPNYLSPTNYGTPSAQSNNQYLPPPFDGQEIHPGSCKYCLQGIDHWLCRY